MLIPKYNKFSTLFIRNETSLVQGIVLTNFQYYTLKLISDLVDLIGYFANRYLSGATCVTFQGEKKYLSWSHGDVNFQVFKHVALKHCKREQRKVVDVTQQPLWKLTFQEFV